MARKPDKQGGEFGTAAYDAEMHPANAGLQALLAGRTQAARDVHHSGGKTDAARIFSHTYDQQPSQTAVYMMGLSAQRDLVARQVERVNDQPFPGVALGPTPGFHRAPNPQPIVGGRGAHVHHAHLHEPERKTRYRFGN